MSWLYSRNRNRSGRRKLEDWEEWSISQKGESDGEGRRKGNRKKRDRGVRKRGIEEGEEKKVGVEREEGEERGVGGWKGKESRKAESYSHMQ